MTRVSSFLLPRSEVLGVYNDEYFNRVTLVNNISPITRSRCWVHQSSSDIRPFEGSDVKECSCGYDIEGADTCAQRLYVEECLKKVGKKTEEDTLTGLVTFGNTRCVGLILPDGVYLFSSFPACEPKSIVGTSLAKTKIASTTDIVCNDCKESTDVTVPVLENTIAALKEIIQQGDAVQEGVTLMEKFIINAEEPDGITNIYQALERAQEAAKSVGTLEGLVSQSDQRSSLEQTVDTKLIDECNQLAEAIIESLRMELVAVCSSIVGVFNSYSQPPLRVRMRWLRHFMALEYHVELSADLSNCFYDEISGRYVPDLAVENVVLHDIVQCSKLSLEGVEDCFRLSLFRLRDYLAVRRIFNSKGEPDDTTLVGNDSFSSTTSDVTPFWWNYYGFSNTLGEGEYATENSAIKRLTRSQSLKAHDDGASTPVARKSRNHLDYPLVATHCISSEQLAHSRGTTFELQSDNKKDLGVLQCPISSSHSLNCKTTPTQSNRSLKNISNEESEDCVSVSHGHVCFCFKCLESVSTLGIHFEARDFKQENLLSTAIFGDVAYASDLEELYNGCNSEDWDEYKTASALRKSIRAAVDASSSLGRAIVNDQGSAHNLVRQSIKVLNTALLSSLRLGDFIYSSRNSVEMRLGDNADSVKEFYELGEPMEGEGSDDSCSSESTLRDIISNSFVVGNNPFNGLYSTFENDQYIQQDLDEPEEAQVLNSKSVVSRTPKRKTASPKERRTYNNAQNSSIDSSSETSGRQSRKCTRDSLSNNEVYVYDLSERNDAASESAVDDWYDSDGSARGSRRQRQKQSTCSLTEIYGNQDALIPMGPLPIGVYFDASRKLWRCQWRENGKFRTKGFSLGHYSSLCEARRACILFRCQVGNMPVQPEWLNPNYVQVSQLLSKRSAASSTATSTPKKSRRKRKAHSNSMDV
ncbi:AP2 [Babesia gibsoni]|uniref:AP2 n=1 Tax=Babesia gibsoni TaxID=33632 RepID=A0AAD8LJZ2_BABGI|nr:AP2 [Babesia gibsoni]